MILLKTLATSNKQKIDVERFVPFKESLLCVESLIRVESGISRCQASLRNCCDDLSHSLVIMSKRGSERNTCEMRDDATLLFIYSTNFFVKQLNSFFSQF